MFLFINKKYNFAQPIVVFVFIEFSLTVNFFSSIIYVYSLSYADNMSFNAATLTGMKGHDVKKGESMWT